MPIGYLRTVVGTLLISGCSKLLKRLWEATCGNGREAWRGWTPGARIESGLGGVSGALLPAFDPRVVRAVILRLQATPTTRDCLRQPIDERDVCWAGIGLGLGEDGNDGFDGVAGDSWISGGGGFNPGAEDAVHGAHVHRGRGGTLRQVRPHCAAG